MERREIIQILAASGALAQTKAAYAPRFFTASQFAAVEQLALALLPEEDASPGARSGEVPRYLDTILLYAGAAIQAEWRQGLVILKPEEFVKVAQAELAPATEAERFFVTFKRLALEAFFQSPAGARFFGYQGNGAIPAFPGCATKNPGNAARNTARNKAGNTAGNNAGYNSADNRKPHSH